MIRSLTVGLLLLPACALCAEEGEWEAPAEALKVKNPVPADARSIARGKEVYTQECLSCHGAKGKGDGDAAATLKKKPADLSQTASDPDGELFWKITEGRRPMPRFGKRLSEEERWSVINYVRTLTPKSQEKEKPGDKP